MTSKTLTDLYTYFDSLLDQDASADTLFASSYVRGFIAVEAVGFGDDEQLLSPTLYQQVSAKMTAVKSELSPQDQMIIADFWQQLADYFNSKER
ncbi:MAG: YfcL family protein [Alteromonadaceae bacterium]|nr:YfcL family protein [Alteromonadaceae bacterium]